MKTKDLTNHHFGNLEVISYAGIKGGRASWNCLCSCGKTRIFKANILQSGRASSCGCKRIKNLTGKRFGRLIVTERAQNKDGYGAARWKCLCDCGNKKEIYSSALVQGRTTSCGCSIHHVLNIGDKFNQLTIIKPFYGKDKNNNYLCKCRCICGKEVVISTHQLVRNKTKSCGCLRNRKKTGKFSGYGDIYGGFWGHIKEGARRRKIPFEIDIKFAWNLFLKQNRKCAISGIPLEFHTDSTASNCSASLDRIDSSKGYLKKNVQWVHKDINWMKQDYSQEEFIHYCKIIAKNHVI